MARVRIGHVFALALIGAFLLSAVGCSDVDRDNDHDRDNQQISARRTADIAGLPRDAQLLDEGHGQVSTRIPDRGTVYLVDTDSGRLIWSGTASRGDRFTVDADKDRASMNGQSVYDRNLERKDRHAVYFVPQYSGRY